MPQRLLMHSSLWLLLRLGLFARLRKLKRLTHTWKGRFAILGLVFMLGFWLFGISYGTGFGKVNPETIRSGGALVIATMLIANLLFGNSEGIAFKPAEVEFLFPSPIPRRQLLIYRIISTALITLPSSIFIGIGFKSRAPMFVGVCVGAWLSFLFLALALIVWQQAAGILGQSLVGRSKKGLAVVLGVIVVAAIATGAMSMQVSLDNATTFAKSSFGQKVLAPFLPFSSVVAAESLPEMARSAGVCVAILVGLVFVILRLDLNHTEASVAASQRVAKRVSDARRGQMAFNKGNAFLSGLSVPKLPRMRGAGPIAWHQLTALLRSAGSLTFFILIVGGAVTLPMTMNNSVDPKQLLVTVVMLSVFMLPQFIQYDFRSELDRMSVLKSLPVHPIAICLGELLAPIIAILTVQAALLCLALGIGGTDIRLIGVIAIFAIPADFLIYAVENFVFLLFPFRMGPGGEQGLQNMVRVMITMVLKMLLIGVFAGLAGGLGALCYYLSESQVLAFAVGWIITLLSCAALLPGLAWAFQRFDPATDTPA
ncbi:MAG: putative ABC exporter domain-containing protein [Planctomycetaceae bacterium]